MKMLLLVDTFSSSGRFLISVNLTVASLIALTNWELHEKESFLQADCDSASQ
jgi:hypothetical protein